MLSWLLFVLGLVPFPPAPPSNTEGEPPPDDDDTRGGFDPNG